jgi:hypothetical protein
MTKGSRTVIGLLWVAAVGVLLWNTSHSGEPKYEGKTLSHWLEAGLLDRSSANPPRILGPGWKRAEEAVRHLGTNAIPTLLRLLRAQDPPPPMLEMLDRLRKQSLVRVRYRYAMERNQKARFAFEILGTNAACAVPALIEIYDEGRSPFSQVSAAEVLGDIGPAAEAAIPALLRNLTNGDYYVRKTTVWAVGRIGGEPSVVVPALRGFLKDPRIDVRDAAMVSLAAFGGHARSAVPEILTAFPYHMNEGDSQKEDLETSLWRIAPEKTGTPLVVEDSTPMVANGVTTKTLDVLYNGERRTLIRHGTPLPCVTQLWDGAPPAPFKLYRGANPTTAKDHFLGQFEVTGVPSPPTNVEVQVVCVIVDHQILLCARDMTRKLFLEVRRLGTEAYPLDRTDNRGTRLGTTSRGARSLCGPCRASWEFGQRWAT